MNPMTCDEFDVLLPDVLEETIDAGSRAAAEGHLATCARCRSLLNDLKELQSEAARLPALSPSHDLWGGISARIETPAIELRDRRGAPGWWQQPRWRPSSDATDAGDHGRAGPREPDGHGQDPQ